MPGQKQDQGALLQSTQDLLTFVMIGLRYSSAGVQCSKDNY